jgi:hypothetical protein
MPMSFGAKVYLVCAECGYGRKDNWIMSVNTYYNGGFIIRECPKCHVIDTRNSIGGKKTKGTIELKAVEY